MKSILLGFLLVALGSVAEPQDTVTLDSAAAVTGTAPGDTAGQPSRASSNLGYSVDGVVTYATGRPAKAAFISLVSPDLNVHSRQAVSDEFGRFRFDGIQGNYLVRVDIPNAASTLRRLYADRNLNISIILDERPVKPEWSWTQTILTVVVLVLFLFTIEVTRWHHIATSIVSMILGHVDTLKARLATEAAGADPAMTKPLNDLLDRVKTEMTRKLRAYSPDLLFWSRGRENANWVLLHEVERQLASFLAPPEQVEAYLRFIGPELRSLNTAPAIAIADAIALEIQAASPDQVTRKALLGRGIAIVNANRDNTFSTLMEWQNKVSWLIVIAVGMIGFLSVGVGNSILFLAGGAGGYLSRLMRAIRRDDIPLDYGASWTTLFLSPLFGALAAWFGIALITVLARPDLQLLGEAFRLVRWDDPRGPATLAIAFVLGFSERCFDAIIGAIDKQAKPDERALPSSPPASSTSASGSRRPAGGDDGNGSPQPDLSSSPVMGSGNLKARSVTRVVDGHTHIFNVGFLPVEGILKSRGVPAGIARHITDALLVLLERDRIAAFDSDVEPFMTMLQAEISGADSMNALTDEDWFARYAAAVPESRIPELRKALPPDVVDQFSAGLRATIGVSREGIGNEDADVRKRLELILRDADAIAGPVETGEEEVGLLGLDLKGLIKWLAMLVQHESRIVEAFPRAWDNGGDFIAHVHLMMDMERHYSIHNGRPPLYSFYPEQLNRMMAVVGGAPIKLIGFAAFDPFRDNGLDIVKHAIDSGFTGIKFYPPNGYKPIDNTDNDIKHGPDAATVNERNLSFFRWCVEKDIPVFAHCTPEGMESRPHETGKFSNPCYWEKVLKKPGLEKLRLCLGHAGGQDGWMASFDNKGAKEWDDSYAKKVFELCCAFDNVYCDFGYFDHILKGDGDKFAKRIAWAFSQNARFSKKCCYGTDWHLMMIRKHARDYPRLFRVALERSDVIKPHIDDFMYGNVLRFIRREDLIPGG